MGYSISTGDESKANGCQMAQSDMKDDILLGCPYP